MFDAKLLENNKRNTILMTDKVNIFGGIKCLAAKMVLVRDTIQRCPSRQRNISRMAFLIFISCLPQLSEVKFFPPKNSGKVEYVREGLMNKSYYHKDQTRSAE